MKRILLLAAVHVLIINQSNKDAKRKVQEESSQKAARQELQAPPHYREPGNKDFVTAAVFSNPTPATRRPSMIQ